MGSSLSHNRLIVSTTPTFTTTSLSSSSITSLSISPLSSTSSSGVPASPSTSASPCPRSARSNSILDDVAATFLLPPSAAVVAVTANIVICNAKITTSTKISLNRLIGPPTPSPQPPQGN